MATNGAAPPVGHEHGGRDPHEVARHEGDEIAEGQPLVEVETAKINSELESPTSGVVSHIMAAEGSLVKVGELVAVIGEPGENPPRPEPGAPASPAAGRRRQRPGRERPARGGGARQVTPVARRLARDNNIDLDQVNGTGPRGRITEQDVRDAIEARQRPQRSRVQVVPRARQLARQEDIDLADVTGSGPNGRIVVADVERAIAERDAGAARAEAIAETVPLTGPPQDHRRPQTMSVSTMAQVTLTTEADVTEMLKLRESLVSEWRPHRLRPLDLDIIVAAVAQALKEHPRLNAHSVDNEVLLLRDVNIGLAVAVPDGLVVPVLRGAGSLDLLGTAQAMRELADKTRKGDLGIDDVTGAGSQ